MPSPIGEDTIKVVWENNPDTPLTSSTLSKDVDFVASYRDFEFALDVHGEGSILVKDPNPPVGAPDQLIMKREVCIGVINRETRIPLNKQYKIFDNGLQDLYIQVDDMDDNASNPLPNKTIWGNNKEWFVFICDAENEMSGQLLVSQSSISPITTQVLGYPAAFYTSNNTRLIGGFKTNGTGNIIEDSVWDISGKSQKVKAKKYYVIDEYNADLEDVYNRSVYRPLRLSDLDSSTSGSNIFSGDVEIYGNLNIDGDLDTDIINSLVVYANGSAPTTSPNTMSIRAVSEIVATGGATSGGQFRAINGNYGVIFRNDGSNFYLLSTNTGDQYGSWNTFRPFAFSLSTGVTTINSLKISGTAQVTGGFDVSSTAPVHSDRLNYDGYFYATRVYNAVYNDLAEYFLSKDNSQPGKVYTLYEDGVVQLSKQRADNSVLGVCSDSAAYVMKDEYREKGGVLIALAGTVKVYVKSMIPCGAELVSDKDGFATRANFFERIFKRAAILGKALECSKDKQEKRISMLVK
jgi:hypothetical protein